MIELKQLQQDFADDQRRSANIGKYFRMLADVYEQQGSVELVAQYLNEALDGNEDPRIAKILVDHIRTNMTILLLAIQLEWKERQSAGVPK